VSAARYRVLTLRRQWGAKFSGGDHRPGARRHVVVHHSLSPSLPASATVEQEVAAMRGMDHYHGAEMGWSGGFAYNFAFFQSGRVYEGRGWDRVGAHAGSRMNPLSYGLVFVIDGRREVPSAEAIASCRWLIGLGVTSGRIVPDYRLSGHRDHMERDCPGAKMYPMIQELRHDAGDGELPEPAVVIEPKRPQAKPPVLDVVRIPKPTPEHIDRIIEIGPYTPEIAEAGARVAEIFLRGVQRAGEAGLKEAADALSDWIIRRIGR
jgi:N-acetylmuramoyl-L-alanine amidase